MLPSFVYVQLSFVTTKVEVSKAGSVSVTVFVVEQLLASLSVSV